MEEFFRSLPAPPRPVPITGGSCLPPTAPPPSVPLGPLAHFFAHPNAWWRDLAHHVAHLGEAVLPAALAVVAGLLALTVARVLLRAGRSSPATSFWTPRRGVHATQRRAQGCVHLLAQPPPGARWREPSFAPTPSRRLQDRGLCRGHQPAAMGSPRNPGPGGRPRRQSAWPGAQCQVRDASGALVPGSLVSCGELRLARPAWLPLGTDHGVDPLRAVLGALFVEEVGEHAVVQVLVRPASHRRLAVISRAARSLPTGRPIALVPRLLAAWRTAPPAPLCPDPMCSADARHAIDKATDVPSFEVTLRYGVSAHASGHGARRRLRAQA